MDKASDCESEIVSSYPTLGEIIFLKHWAQISIAKNNTEQNTGYVNQSLRITTCTKIKKSTENESPRIEKVCTRDLPKGGSRAHFFYPRRFYNTWKIQMVVKVRTLQSWRFNFCCNFSEILLKDEIVIFIYCAIENHQNLVYVVNWHFSRWPDRCWECCYKLAFLPYLRASR